MPPLLYSLTASVTGRDNRARADTHRIPEYQGAFARAKAGPPRTIKAALNIFPALSASKADGSGNALVPSRTTAFHLFHSPFLYSVDEGIVET
jgi:hypothetical protein